MAKPHFSQCWVHLLKATVNGNRPNGDKNLTDAEAVCFTEEKKICTHFTYVMDFCITEIQATVFVFMTSQKFLDLLRFWILICRHASIQRKKCSPKISTLWQYFSKTVISLANVEQQQCDRKEQCVRIFIHLKL